MIDSGMVFQKILLLGIGGFLGSNLRYWISLKASQAWGVHFPFGTLIVNALGSFLLGIILILGSRDSPLDGQIKLMLGTGLMGALTTFSTFSVETVQLLEKSQFPQAALHILLNVITGIAFAYLGFLSARSLLAA